LAKHKYTWVEIYKDLKNSGKDAVFSIAPYVRTFVSTINDENDLFPLSGISNKLTISCNESGYWAIYESDRHGFNNPDEVWDKLNFDYVLIGDSFAHGQCVHEKDTIAGRLRYKAKVLNLGYGGTGPLLEYATAREYLKYIKTKNVLWFYFDGNDLNDLKLELSNKILIKYLKDINFTQGLFNRQKEIDYFGSNALVQELKKYKKKDNTLFRFEEFNFKNVLFLKSIRHRLSWVFRANLINPYPFIIDYLDEFSELLTQTNNLVTKNNSKLYFVYLPEYPGIYNSTTDKQRLLRYKKVINLVKRLNIPIIDLYKDVFSNHSDPKSLFPLRTYGHYNEEGYRLVVKTILDKI